MYFTQTVGKIQWILADYDSTLKAEYHYFCVDNYRLDGFIDLLVQLKLKLPSDNFKSIVKILNFLNFLNLTVRLEAGLILGGQVATSDVQVTAAFSDVVFQTKY